MKCSIFCKKVYTCLGVAFLLIVALSLVNLNFTSLYTAIGAFFGTATAFLLGAWFSERDTMRKQAAILKKVHYILGVHQKEIEQIQNCITQYGDYEGDYHGWEKIQRMESFDNSPSFELNEVMFLLEFEKKGKELLNAILLADWEYRSCEEIIKRRNFYYDKYLEKTRDREDAVNKDIYLKDKLGSKFIYEIEQYTTRLTELNNKSCKDTKLALGKLNGFIQEKFNIILP